MKFYGNSLIGRGLKLWNYRVRKMGNISFLAAYCFDLFTKISENANLSGRKLSVATAVRKRGGDMFFRVNIFRQQLWKNNFLQACAYALLVFSKFSHFSMPSLEQSAIIDILTEIFLCTQLILEIHRFCQRVKIDILKLFCFKFFKAKKVLLPLPGIG